MSKQPLDIVYCKNCRFYKKTIQSERASVHTCLKWSDKFDLVKPELYCNKSCYSESLIRKRIKK